jgi:hypothetical protein
MWKMEVDLHVEYPRWISDQDFVMRHLQFAYANRSPDIGISYAYESYGRQLILHSVFGKLNMLVSTAMETRNTLTSIPFDEQETVDAKAGIDDDDTTTIQSEEHHDRLDERNRIDTQKAVKIVPRYRRTKREKSTNLSATREVDCFGDDSKEATITPHPQSADSLPPLKH